MKCFDIVAKTIDDVNMKFHGFRIMDHRKLKILKNYCEVIDIVLADVDGSYIEVEVNDLDMNIDVKIGCKGILVLENPLFIELIHRTVSVEFIQEEEDEVQITLEFPTLWVDVE